MAALIKIEAGLHVLAGNDIVEVVGSVSSGKIQVKNLETGTVYLIKPGDIRGEIKTKKSLHKTTSKPTSESLPYYEEFDELELAEAKRRFEIISLVLSEQGTKSEKNEKIAELIGVSVPHVFRLTREFSLEDGFISLMRQKSGQKKGTTRLCQEVENIIFESFNTVYKGLGATKAAVVARVNEMCNNLGVRPPSKRAVHNRINQIDRSELTARKEGQKRSKQQNESRGGKVSLSRPLELVQMDHAYSDLIVVDEKTRRPLGRPWITFAIDIDTRVILGLYVSLSSPSGMAVALCLANAILPKEKWLRSIGLETCEYPFYGIPKRIHVDNAKEFRSPVLIGGCDKYGIKLTWRPPGQPWNGAHVERAIGTFMRKIHTVPGTTMSSVPKRRDYDSEKHSVFTLAEFRQWLVGEVEIYHKTLHSGIGSSPLQKWEEAFRTSAGVLTHPDLVEDQQALLLNFMPRESRKITRAGVKLLGIEYYSVSLKVFNNGTSCIVRYDPGSMKQIWVKPEGESDYIQLNYSDVSLPDVSLEELNFAKAQRRSESERRAPYSEVIALAVANRNRIEISTNATRKERKQNERSKLRDTDISHPLHVAEKSITVKKVDDVDYARKPKILDSGY